MAAPVPPAGPPPPAGAAPPAAAAAGAGGQPEIKEPSPFEKAMGMLSIVDMSQLDSGWAADAFYLSEEYYVEQGLRVVVELQRRLRHHITVEQVIIDEMDIMNLFLNLEQLYDFNQKLYNALKDIRLEGRAALLEQLGAVMVQHTPFFKLYAAYIKNVRKAQELLTSLQTKSSKFARWLRLNELCAGVELAVLLELPTTRLPQYLVFLGTVHQKMPDPSSPASQSLDQAISLIKKATDDIATTLRDEKARKLVVTLQAQLFRDNTDLISPSRYVVKHGDLKIIYPKSLLGKRFKEFVCIAYNDCLLVGTRPGITAGKVKHVIRVEGMMVEDVPDADDYKCSFKVSSQIHDVTLHLMATTAKSKRKWMEALCDAIEKHHATLLSQKVTPQILTSEDFERQIKKQKPKNGAPAMINRPAYIAPKYTSRARKDGRRAAHASGNQYNSYTTNGTGGGGQGGWGGVEHKAAPPASARPPPGGPPGGPGRAAAPFQGPPGLPGAPPSKPARPMDGGFAAPPPMPARPGGAPPPMPARPGGAPPPMPARPPGVGGNAPSMPPRPSAAKPPPPMPPRGAGSAAPPPMPPSRPGGGGGAPPMPPSRPAAPPKVPEPVVQPKKKWEKLWDEGSQSYYYECPETLETSWDPPNPEEGVIIGEEPEEPAEAAPPLPAFNAVPTPPVNNAPPAVPSFGGPSSAPAMGGPPVAPTMGGPPSAPSMGGPPSAPAMGGPPSAPTFGGPPSAPTLSSGGPSSGGPSAGGPGAGGPGGGGGRGNLLASIRAGRSLKKVQTNDRSDPLNKGTSNNDGGGGLAGALKSSLARYRKVVGNDDNDSDDEDDEWD